MLQYCAKREVDLFLSLCMNTIAWFCHLVTFKWFFHSINYDFSTKLDEWFWILLINDFFFNTYVWMIDISHDHNLNKKNPWAVQVSFVAPRYERTPVSTKFWTHFFLCPRHLIDLCVEFWFFYHYYFSHCTCL